MRSAILRLLCGCMVAGLLAPAIAWAQDRHGSIAAWGRNDTSQCNVPAANTDFVAVAAFDHHSLGLKADGSIMAWGENPYGQCNVPAPNAEFINIAANRYYSLDLNAGPLGQHVEVQFLDPGRSSMAVVAGVAFDGRETAGETEDAAGCEAREFIQHSRTMRNGAAHVADNGSLLRQRAGKLLLEHREVG